MYHVTEIEPSTDGHGFSISDSTKKPLVRFEFGDEAKAEEAHRVLRQVIDLAIKITQPR